MVFSFAEINYRERKNRILAGEFEFWFLRKGCRVNVTPRGNWTSSRPVIRQARPP